MESQTKESPDHLHKTTNNSSHEDHHEQPQQQHEVGIINNNEHDHHHDELNLIDKVGSSSNHPRQGSRRELIIRFKYSCNYCDRKFNNAQALGGHQNAHKRERITLAKKCLQEDDVPVPLPAAFSYSNMLNHDHHHHHHHPLQIMGSVPITSLGIQTHTMKRKSSYSLSQPSSATYSHGYWSRHPIPAMAHYQQPQLSNPVADGSVQCVTNNMFSNGCINVVGSSSVPVDDGRYRNNNYQEELQKLDLSLKLS